MRITSLELWDTLEEKVLLVSKGTEKIDPILSERLSHLVRHFNGNISSNRQFVCIENIENIYANISRESYYRERKYNQDEIDMVLSISDDLNTLLKVLRSEYKSHLVIEDKAKDKPERLPNINTDKVFNMYKSN